MRLIALLLILLVQAPLALGADDLSCIESEGFNAKVSRALEAGQGWPYHPVALSLMFIGQRHGGQPQISHQEEIHMQSQAEAFDKAVVTVIRSGFMDDSVAGDKFVISLTKQNDDSWLIESARHGHTCWQGRGHQDYSKELCL